MKHAIFYDNLIVIMQGCDKAMTRKNKTLALICGLTFCIALIGVTQSIRSAIAQPAADAQAPYLTQIGPHALASYNVHEPFLNIAKTWNGEWQLEMQDGSILSAAQLRELGAIDTTNGMPSFMPEGGKAFLGPGLFFGASWFPDYYADNYVMSWEGRGYGFLTGQPSDMQTRIGPNKLTFAARFDNPNMRHVRFSRIGKNGPAHLSIYRRNHKKRIDNGELWNPRHIENLSNYDIIRTMDYQYTNASPITQFDEVATIEDAAWGRGLQTTWPAPPRYGVPYEVLFDLAKQTNSSLWLNAPPLIGAPFHIADPALRMDDKPDVISPQKVANNAKENAPEILTSTEWEEFAGQVIDRLIASGYPSDRMLYFELGNEIWNTAGGFAIHTNYAGGIAIAENPEWNFRHGYGMLSARWAMAFDTELKKRGRNQKITYVLGGQTAWPGSSSMAIEGFKHQLRLYENDRNTILKNTGVAIASYHGCFAPFSKMRFGDPKNAATLRAFEKAIRNDANALSSDIHDFCLEGPATTLSTKNWVLSHWRQHNAIAKKEGIQFIGAYEGGAGDGLPSELSQSTKIKKFWESYLWGEDGADVARQINQALVDTFPGVILSNYISIGPVGGPIWVDGGYDENTPMQQMWQEFSRKEREK